MLYPIDHAWGPATPVILEETTEKKMPVEEDDVPEPPTRTLKIPLPTMPHPETIQSVCMVLTVVLLFFLLLEMKEMVRLMRLLR